MPKLDLTDEQLKAITNGGGTMLVAAGAGSGKTFMLTQRIEYLFSPESGKNFGHANMPAIADIDQVCAITFTEKAAEELKSRIRAKLIEIGQEEQALKVDSSWISTIHGMCARILKSFAVDLEIDPEFKIIVDVDEQALLNLAFEQAIHEVSLNEDDNKYKDLLDEYQLIGAGFSQGLRDVVLELVHQAAMSVNGFAEIKNCKPHFDAFKTCNYLIEAYERAQQLVSQAKPSDTQQTTVINIAESISTLKDALSDEQKLTLNGFAGVLNKCIRPPKNFGGADVKDAVAEVQHKLEESCCLLADAWAARHWDCVMELAVLTDKNYSQLKTEHKVLDNNDLLTKTLFALDQCRPVSEMFKRKFKLVMVDEFQDTSSLQIAVISKILGAAQNLNVVGDAQQSIYRFQGADVSVFNRFKEDLINSEDKSHSKYRTMTTNFRSSQNVLKFVEKIFSSKYMFGSEFLHLDCGNKDISPKTGDSGIHFIAVGKNNKANVNQTLQVKAQLIAKKFKSFEEAGYKPQDMVLLLGKMTHANDYANALRQYGFDCVVASGSNLTDTNEIGNVVSCVSYFQSPNNTMARFNVLTGPMFNISAAETEKLFKGEPTNPETNDAAALLDEAAEVARHDSIADGVKHLFVYSG